MIASPPRKNLLRISATLVGSICCLMLYSCGHQSGGTITVYKTDGYQPNFGPFDSRGNYVERWADAPPKRKYVSRNRSERKAAEQKKRQSLPAAPIAQPTYAAVAQPPQRTYQPPASTASKASPPKKKKVTVAAKPKPKKKSSITHTVRKGDTLYGLARKYHTSVSAIQKANRMKGTTIGLGKKLKIPR